MDETNRLTGVISSAREALEMLWWCSDAFQGALNDNDGDGSRQGFALIAFAQASANLHAWVCAEVPNMTSNEPKNSALFHQLSDEIRWTREFRAIAEAARHAKSSSKWWGGENIPILRGNSGRMEELDALEGDDWFHSLMQGLSDRSLWFENSLSEGDSNVDARHAILNHAESWQSKMRELGLF